MAREILGLDPTLGIEDEFEAAHAKAKAHGVSLVGFAQLAYQPGCREARFVRRSVMGRTVENGDCFCVQRPDDDATPPGEWLAKVTDDAIAALGVS